MNEYANIEISQRDTWIENWRYSMDQQNDEERKKEERIERKKERTRKENNTIIMDFSKTPTLWLRVMNDKHNIHSVHRDSDCYQSDKQLIHNAYTNTGSNITVCKTRRIHTHSCRKP